MLHSYYLSSQIQIQYIYLFEFSVDWPFILLQLAKYTDTPPVRNRLIGQSRLQCIPTWRLMLIMAQLLLNAERLRPF